MNTATALPAATEFPAVPAKVLSLPDGRRYDILVKRLEDGRRQAGQVFESLQNDLPTDQIAKVDALAIRPSEDGKDAGKARSIILGVGDGELVPSAYALGQIAERANVPVDYLRRLAASENDWERELAAENLRKHFAHHNGQRALLRSVRGQLRGFLSDKFRRLDCRPLADALAEEANKVGAVPFGGSITETRVALKVVFPEPIIINGDPVLVGIEWSNSDFGNGAHATREFLLRVLCLNGATGEDKLREVHLGRRLSETIEYSQRTYALDTAASESALRDTVKGVLGPAGRAALVEKVEAASSKEFSAAQLTSRIKDEPKATQKLIVDAFKSEDVINLPPGNTAWRASNAISWIAKNTEDPERRLDLERLAGKVL